MIDALDECESEIDIKLILQLLAKASDLSTVRLRVFVTSRPETPIRLGFLGIPGDVHEDVVLHNIPQPIIEHDVFVFVKHELANIRKERALSLDWPSDEHIQLLVKRADGLFIFASTVCRFIGDPKFPPQRRLLDVLKGGSAGPSHLQNLDKMYTQVLTDSVIGDHKGQEEEELARRFRHIVGSIATLFDSLSAPALANLLDMDKEVMDLSLGDMRSVLHIPESQHSPIRTLHPSFPQFLLDKGRCSDRFWVDEEKTHENLAECCIRLMSNSLTKNICSLRTPGTLASEVESKQVEHSLPADVQYACRYWVQHFEHLKPLQRRNTGLRDDGQVHMFLREHFLHWLEALSLMGKMTEGVLMVAALKSMLQVCESVEHAGELGC